MTLFYSLFTAMVLEHRRAIARPEANDVEDIVYDVSPEPIPCRDHGLI